MNVLSVPRTAAALQYRAMRLPAQLVETQLMTRLSEDTAVRLGYERALGTLDRVAGHLLADDELTRRGEAMIERADMLERAAKLAQEAAAAKQEADERLEAEQEAAEDKREQAKRKPPSSGPPRRPPPRPRPRRRRSTRTPTRHWRPRRSGSSRPRRRS